MPRGKENHGPWILSPRPHLPGHTGVPVSEQPGPEANCEAPGDTPETEPGAEDGQGAEQCPLPAPLGMNSYICGVCTLRILFYPG